MREADLCGSNLDYETRVHMILNSLLESFKGFIDLTNNVEFELQILANELETYEKLNNFGDDKVKVTKNPSVEIKRVLEKCESSEPCKTKRKKANKNTEKCFHCNVDGHWKRNCPKYLAELAEKKRQNGKFDLHVLEALLVEVDISSWIIHSGATNHICSSLLLLILFRELAEGELIMRVGNGATVLVKAIGEVRL